MKKRRLISALSAVAMLFSFAACGEAAQDGPASQLPASQTPTSSAPGTAVDDFMLAMGNADVPVGQYTQKILAYYDLSEDSPAVADKITYGSNVKEVTTQISEGTVSCGIIYQTDAYSAGLTVVDTATKEMCGQVIYPAAVMNVSRHPEDAQAFLDYLTGAKAAQVFEKVGGYPYQQCSWTARSAHRRVCGIDHFCRRLYERNADGNLGALSGGSPQCDLGIHV